MSFEQEDNEDEVIDDEEHFDETLEVGLDPAEFSSIDFAAFDGISLPGGSLFSSRLFAICPSSFFSECIGHFDLLFCGLYCGLLWLLDDSLSWPFDGMSPMNFHCNGSVRLSLIGIIPVDLTLRTILVADLIREMTSS